MFLFSIIICLLQLSSDRVSQLPDQFKKMILDVYPKSEIVVCTYDIPRQKKPASFIQGDFNGDSKPDFAVIAKINAPAPNCYCIVFLSSETKYSMKVLKEPYMYCSPHKTLRLNKKGSEIFSLGEESGIILANDAFTIYTEICFTFIYEKNDFTVVGTCD